MFNSVIFQIITASYKKTVLVYHCVLYPYFNLSDRVQRTRAVRAQTFRPKSLADKNLDKPQLGLSYCAVILSPTVQAI